MGTTVLANGIVPLVTAVTEARLAPVVLSLTVGIIFLEAWLLGRSDAERPFGQWLRITALANVASSLVGSLFLEMTRDRVAVMPIGFGDVGTLFLLTVATEFALLNWLCREWNTSGRFWFARAVSVNLRSYGLLLGGQLALFVAMGLWGNRENARRLVEWTDEEILNNGKGAIYAFVRNDAAQTLEFRRYDVGSREWNTVGTNVPSFNPFIWDVAGDKIVCVPGQSDHGGSEIRIHRLPDFSLSRITESSVSEVEISHDGKLLAVVGNEGEAVVQRDSDSCFAFGRKGFVTVFDLETGKVKAQSKRRALNRGLAWSGDDAQVFFVSLNDETLFDHDEKTVGGSTGYWRAFCDGPMSQATYAWHVESDEIEHFASANNPQTVPGSEVVWLSGKVGAVRISIDRRSETVTGLGRRLALSPDGELAVSQIAPRMMFSAQQWLTVVSLREPDRRLILSPNSIYSFRWADTVTTQPPN